MHLVINKLAAGGGVVQKSCYKMVGLSDERCSMHAHKIHGNKIIMIVLWLGVSLCSTDALAL